jgi:hypothetical protein
LELFLASLVNECVKDATERGSKKITAYGLCVPFHGLSIPLCACTDVLAAACRKRTITNVATFDFLADVVAGVADPITEEGGDDAPKKTRAKRKPKVKAEGEGGEDGDEGEPKPKRKRAAAKKKEVVAESGEVKEEEGAEQKGSEEEVEEVKPKKGSDEDGGEYDQDEEDDDDE